MTDLGHYVENHPGTADALTAAAITGPLTDEEFMRTICDFLTRIFEMVQTLGHPAVLPGFLTGTDYLAVIDVRTPPGKQLEMPSTDGQEITLWTPPAPSFMPVHWMPRLWLVRATDEELASDPDKPGKLADALQTGDPDTTSVQLAEALERQPLVTGITRRHVIVQHVQMPLADLPPAPIGESSRIPWAESPDGIKAMLAALTNQLGQRQQQDLLWIRALAQPQPEPKPQPEPEQKRGRRFLGLPLPRRKRRS